MKLQEYRNNKIKRSSSEAIKLASLRSLCNVCRNSLKTCYCSDLKPFKSEIEFVILMHAKEVKEKIGTGRMTHLCISNSRLFEGVDFSGNDEVNTLIKDNRYFPMVLYPGKNSIPVDKLDKDELEEFLPSKKKILLFVIDGTWSMAKKIMKLSKNLHNLPRISFTPAKISSYKIRIQPDKNCVSTIEAVHSVIDIFDRKKIFNVKPAGAHSRLLKNFSKMVERQLKFAKSSVGKGYRKKPPGEIRVRKAKKWEKRSLFYNG